MGIGVAGDKGSIVLGAQDVSVRDVVRVAHGEKSVVLSAACVQRLERGVQALAAVLRRGEAVYGVNTGFGDSCENHVDAPLMASLAANLVHFHGCGVGPYLDVVESRAVVLARLASLVRGYSAVRPIVVERLVELLNVGVTPRIPCQGSVGASGDLTPLSYVAAMLMGEREALFRGQVLACRSVLEHFELKPLQLGPKESLALMNGTSVMSALACLAIERLQRLARWCCALTAIAVDVTEGQPSHFDEAIFRLKPHPGQAAAARWVRQDLGRAHNGGAHRIQDRYSLRCAPHVIGVALDHLVFARQVAETELNGVNDNPMIDWESEQVLHSGNFYGGHIAQIMDTLKPCAANLADLLDRQLVLVCHPSTSQGLPANLVMASHPACHHGFKAMQITTSALAAEACKLTMPASVFSRSTENHNQDKVSMGTIAARDCLQIIGLVETVAAIVTLAMAQAVDLRGRERVGPRALEMHAAVRAEVAANSEDRRMDMDIELITAAWRSGRLPCGALDFG